MAASIAKHEYCKKICSLYKTTSAIFEIHKRCIMYGPKQKDFPQHVSVDPSVLAAVESGAAKFRRHDGSMVHRMIEVPEKLQQAADIVLEKYPANQLIEKAGHLNEALLRRLGPLERDDMRQRYNTMLHQVRTTEKQFVELDNSEMSKEELEKLTSTLHNTAVARLRKTTHSWNSVKFNSQNCLTYLVARLARNYAVMKTIFNEIKKRDPDFKPGSIYDNNAGLGTTIWAANSVWEKSVFEYYCVNPSTHLTNTARLLLQNGSEAASMCIPGVFFRQFQPADKNYVGEHLSVLLTSSLYEGMVTLMGQFRMSVCAYTLFEQPSRQHRLQLVQHLWNSADTYMVLVEMGTNAGYQMIEEARDFILQNKDKDPKYEAHVVAPCPHDEVCPKLQYTNYPCTFDTYFKHLNVGKIQNELKRTEKYTYLVMKKSPRPPGVTWPRVTQPTIKSHRHTHCYLCCPDGTMNHTIVSRKKHQSDVYAVARHSIYGDLLPVVWSSSDEAGADKHVVIQSEDNLNVDNVAHPDMDSSEEIIDRDLSESSSMSDSTEVSLNIAASNDNEQSRIGSMDTTSSDSS